jgi:hypothetical protein
MKNTFAYHTKIIHHVTKIKRNKQYKTPIRRDDYNDILDTNIKELKGRNNHNLFEDEIYYIAT